MKINLTSTTIVPNKFFLSPRLKDLGRESSLVWRAAKERRELRATAAAAHKVSKQAQRAEAKAKAAAGKSARLEAEGQASAGAASSSGTSAQAAAGDAATASTQTKSAAALAAEAAVRRLAASSAKAKAEAKRKEEEENDVLLLLDATSSPKQQEQRGASFPRVSFNFSCRGISRGRRCRRWGRPAAAAATVFGSCLVNEPFSFFFVREVIDVIKPTARFVVVGDEERGRGRRRRKF